MRWRASPSHSDLRDLCELQNYTIWGKYTKLKENWNIVLEENRLIQIVIFKLLMVISEFQWITKDAYI